MMHHRIKFKVVRVLDSEGNPLEVVRCGKTRLPQRIIKFPFGEFCNIMVFKPGQTVTEVRIIEEQENLTEQEEDKF